MIKYYIHLKLATYLSLLLVNNNVFRDTVLKFSNTQKTISKFYHETGNIAIRFSVNYIAILTIFKPKILAYRTVYAVPPDCFVR